MRHYLNQVETAIRQCWNQPALTNLGQQTYTFGEVAVQIEEIHILLELAGVRATDHVVLCARNSAQWAMFFLGIVTYDAVAVPLLNEFLPENVQQLIVHSHAKAVFTEESIWNALDVDQLQEVCMAIDVQTGKVLFARMRAAEKLSKEVADTLVRRFPRGVRPQDIHYCDDRLDELEVINYTSGTSGTPKGVMLSARNISSNIEYAFANMPAKAGWHILSMLPLAHMYGLLFEFLFPLSAGCQVFFLGKAPTPSVLMRALADVKPFMLITVPLVVEKIFKSKVIPTLEKRPMPLLLRLPIVRGIVLGKVRRRLLEAFGGCLSGGLIVGGAAISEQTENLLRRMHFPYTVGYGMTECGPLICYADKRTYVLHSCGRMVDGMEVRFVAQEQYADGVGEIELRGDHVMMGYFNNPEATAQAFTTDGWLRTGDLGLVDADGNLFIRGRSKNMILGANGQNIYPEEIEDKLNALPVVAESIVVSRARQLVALVVPDMNVLGKLVEKGHTLESVMADCLSRLNGSLPGYSKIHKIEVFDKPFEKTPKKSIKRFLYS